MAEISLKLGVLLERSEATVRALKENNKSHEAFHKGMAANENEISRLKVKQNLVTWVGGVCTVTGMGVIGKWVYELINHKTPHL